MLSCPVKKTLFAIVALPGLVVALAGDAFGETLYNGIVLPKEWPPKIDIADRRPMPVPYLEKANIPKVIPIDVGRQLFVDDFLVAATQGVKRVFFKPRKYHANPLLWPETKNELGLATELGDRPYPKNSDGTYKAPWRPDYKTAPCCYTSGGGLWYDPTRKVFRLWYIAGWSQRIAYAESKDLIHWERPPVGLRGTNILRDWPNSWDTWVVWPNFAAKNPYADWKLYHSYGGNPGSGYEYESTDGITWKEVARCGLAGDASTMFYNPFRGKWVWSLRSVWRGRSRNYREHSDFVKGAAWHFPMDAKTAADGARPFYIAGQYTNTCDVVNWMACDDQDLPKMLDGKTFTNAQLYNFDATPYESVMIGLHKIMCGRDNGVAAHVGMPKTTEIHFGYSRDGFHFDRPDRTPAIGDSGWWSGEWDAGYLAPVSSGFVIKDEELWFLYAAMRGDTSSVEPPECTLANGMHANGSIGAAILRRDGFAGMVADGRGELVTRPVRFSGSHFFVNADTRFGSLAVEVLDAAGKVVKGYSAADCMGLDHRNATKAEIRWKGGDLKRFTGHPVRFRFKMHVTTLYSFWVSQDAAGHSGGYLGGGGPDYPALRDVESGGN